MKKGIILVVILLLFSTLVIGVNYINPGTNYTAFSIEESAGLSSVCCNLGNNRYALFERQINNYPIVDSSYCPPARIQGLLCLNITEEYYYLSHSNCSDAWGSNPPPEIVDKSHCSNLISPPPELKKDLLSSILCFFKKLFGSAC